MNFMMFGVSQNPLQVGYQVHLFIGNLQEISSPLRYLVLLGFRGIRTGDPQLWQPYAITIVGLKCLERLWLIPWRKGFDSSHLYTSFKV